MNMQIKRLARGEYKKMTIEEKNARRRELFKNLEIKAKQRIYAKKYYIKNFERIKIYKNTWCSRRRKLYLLNKIRNRCKKENIEFNLSIEDIDIPKYCPLLNFELTNEFGKGQLYSNSSVDRIDSTKGYIKGNVWIMSRLANTMKSNATKEQLLTFSQNIIKIFGT